MLLYGPFLSFLLSLPVPLLALSSVAEFTQRVLTQTRLSFHNRAPRSGFLASAPLREGVKNRSVLFVCMEREIIEGIRCFAYSLLFLWRTKPRRVRSCDSAFRIVREGVKNGVRGYQKQRVESERARDEDAMLEIQEGSTLKAWDQTRAPSYGG